MISEDDYGKTYTNFPFAYSPEADRPTQWVTKFDVEYARTARDVLSQEPMHNVRLGHRCYTMPGAVFAFEGSFPLLTLRDIKPYWFVAEVMWFLQGVDDTQFMRNSGFTTWDKFLDKDGRCTSNYGYRWQRATSVNQLQEAINKLSTDLSTRHAVLCTWLPEIDGRLEEERPNRPCVSMLHLSTSMKPRPDRHTSMVMTDFKLDVTALQRSADMYFGLPHDIAGIALLQRMLASHLHIDVGRLTLAVSNLHIYANQVQNIKAMLSRFDERCVFGTSMATVDYYPNSSFLERSMAEKARFEDLWKVQLAMRRGINHIYLPFSPEELPRKPPLAR